MSTPSDPYRAYRRGGKLVLEIDESCFASDATSDDAHRILDRDAFLAFACENVFQILHDDDTDAGFPSWWIRFSHALCADASERGAGVIPNDGSAALPIDQPPDLFPDDLIRELLGRHVKESRAAG